MKQIGEVWWASQQYSNWRLNGSLKNLNLARKKFCVRNILSNELVAKDQSFPRLNESRRADFSRGLCGARTVLDLDYYAERKKGGGRERERRGSDRGEVENGKRIRRLLRRTLASLPSGLRRGGIQVRKDVTWKFIGTTRGVEFVFLFLWNRVERSRERKH